MIRFIFAVLIGTSLAMAQYGYGVTPGAVVEDLGNGAINYSQGIITATGIGSIPEYAVNAGQARAMAIRAAKTDARRQLVELVNGITLNSETTMKNRMADEVVQEKVSGVIRGAYQVGDVRYLSDTSVELTMAVSMSGISEIVTPDASAFVAPPALTGPQPPEAALPAAASGPLTGIIIDARGLGVRPAMAPKIVGPNNSTVYGPGHYTRDFAIQFGVTGYSKSLEAAQEDQRVKGNPLVVRGVSAQGSNSADIVVDSPTAWKIQSAEQKYGILKACRVLILLD